MRYTRLEDGLIGLNQGAVSMPQSRKSQNSEVVTQTKQRQQSFLKDSSWAVVSYLWGTWLHLLCDETNTDKPLGFYKSFLSKFWCLAIWIFPRKCLFFHGQCFPPLISRHFLQRTLTLSFTNLFFQSSLLEIFHLPNSYTPSFFSQADLSAFLKVKNNSVVLSHHEILICFFTTYNGNHRWMTLTIFFISTIRISQVFMFNCLPQCT